MTDTVRVPREPTEAMLQGACDKHKPGQPMSEDRPEECPRFQTRRRIYRAMLAASPPQPDALPGDLRERVARLIAKPGVFSLDNEEAHRAASPRAANIVRGDALAKADAILFLIQSERGGA